MWWKIYVRWYDNQTPETQEVVKRFFEKKKNCYFSMSKGKVTKI